MAQKKPKKKRPTFEELEDAHRAELQKRHPDYPVKWGWFLKYRDRDAIIYRSHGQLTLLHSYIDENNEIRHEGD